MTTETTVVEQHYGPLPPAASLREYDDVMAGLAERIVRMAEIPLEMGQAQMLHRHELERQVILSDIRRSWAGLAVATLFGLVVLGGGLALLFAGRSVEGLTSLVGGLSSLVGVFIYSSRKKDQDLEQRKQLEADSASRR